MIFICSEVVSETTPSTSGQGNIADETTRQLSELKVVEEDTCSSIAPNNTDAMDSTGIEHDALIDEFRSIMENRFMCGEDDHVDYKQIDSDESIQASKWREQDIEDAYFGDSESCSESWMVYIVRHSLSSNPISNLFWCLMHSNDQTSFSIQVVLFISRQNTSISMSSLVNHTLFGSIRGSAHVSNYHCPEDVWLFGFKLELQLIIV